MKIALVVLLAFGAVCGAQTVDAGQSSSVLVAGPVPQQKTLPATRPSLGSSVPDALDFRAGYMCGAGGTTSSVAAKPTLGCGVGITFFPLIFAEVGVMGPQANRSYVSGYVSVDANVPLGTVRKRYGAQLLAGYSRLFETGHALDYGLAVNLPRKGENGDGGDLRIELRDYWTFANPSQHNVMLRVGWMIGGPLD